MLKNLQNILFGLRAHNQWLGKRTHILPPSQAVAGHTAHGQQGQHLENAEVIGHRQLVFNL